MNRFLVDTWWEALLRPFAMAAPNGHVYVEIIAPDFRFVFAILLFVLLLAARLRGHALSRTTTSLLLLVVVSFVPWLATTGNGRYFLAILLLAGPLCLALIYAQPWTRNARMACAAGMLALQAFAVIDARPWAAWSLASWRDAPYFQLEIPEDLRTTPATFVTITSISYSLLAPQFHPSSSWVNISAMSGDANAPDTHRARALFARSQHLYALLPTVPDEADTDRLPKPGVQDTIDRHLASQHLALDRSQKCRMLVSRTAAQIIFGEDGAPRNPDTYKSIGFWVCALQYPVVRPPGPIAGREIEAVYDKIEKDCPGIFPPRSAITAILHDGTMRNYAGADMKLYVMRDDQVYYKYWRALNPERIGTIAQVMDPSFQMDCHNIRGRSGLPWQRSI